MNFHSSVVIYIGLIKEMSMVVQKIIQVLSLFLLWNLFWRSKTSNRYCSSFICHSPCSINNSPLRQRIRRFHYSGDEKVFSLGHEITRGSYNLYSAFSYILNSPVPVAVSLTEANEKGTRFQPQPESCVTLWSVTRYTNVRQQHWHNNDSEQLIRQEL